MGTKRPLPTEFDESVHLGTYVPLGHSSFARLISDNCTFVDKSLMIAEVLSTKIIVQLILRPRRFGKSLNLSMLQSFFDIKCAAENRKLFSGLRIERQHPDLFKEGGAFGRHPVIYLDLKQLKLSSWDEMLVEIRTILSDTYSQFPYLLKSTFLQRHEKKLFKRIMLNNETVNESQLRCSLQKLSGFLTQYHKDPCVILIDEYDIPLSSAHHKGFFEKARDFFGLLFSNLLKGNDTNVFKAVLVGILRVSKSDFLSGLNNITVHSFQDSEFCDKFGFTNEEVEALLKQHQPGLMGNDIIKSWYNGYRSNNIVLFNPWSIINLCFKGVVKNYWVDTGSTGTIQSLLPSRTETFINTAYELMRFETVSLTINESLHYENLKHTAKDSDLWTLIYFGGYLGHISAGKFRIPNWEVYSEWVTWLMPKLCKQEVRDLIIESLIYGKVEKFSNELPNIVMECFSYHDVGGSTAGVQAESFYHAFFLGLVTSARTYKYDVTSNRESGTGRYDLSLMPTVQISSSVGVIIEFKVAGEKDDLKATALIALNQISEKIYRRHCPSELTTLCEYGIAFKGKLCHVVGETLIRDGKVWKIEEPSTCIEPLS